MNSAAKNNSKVSGSTVGTKNGSGFTKSMSTTGNTGTTSSTNGGTGEGASSSGNSKVITGYAVPGGGVKQAAPAEAISGLNGYGSGFAGMQQGQPNVIRRPPVILRNGNTCQGTTSGIQRILRCLDGRPPQNRRGSQPPGIRPPIVCPVAPGCYPPPPACCFPPLGCCPPGCCPPPGFFPPGCCPPPTCFPPGCFPPPGCCPPPPGGCFPIPPGCPPPIPFNQICFPRPPGMPQQNSLRFPSSQGMNNTGTGGSDSPYFNNCNFYMNEPNDSNQSTPHSYPHQPSLYSHTGYPATQPSYPPESYVKVNSLPQNEKSNYPHKVKRVRDSDSIKSRSSKSSSNAKVSSDCSNSTDKSLDNGGSKMNSRDKCNRDKGSCSCTRCFENLVEKEVSRRLRKLRDQAGSNTHSKHSCTTNSTHLSHEVVNPIQKLRSVNSVGEEITEICSCSERSSIESSYCQRTTNPVTKNSERKSTSCTNRTETGPDKCFGRTLTRAEESGNSCSCPQKKTPLSTAPRVTRDTRSNCYKSKSTPCVDAKRSNVDKCNSAFGFPSMSTPCIPAKMDDCTSTHLPRSIIGKPLAPVLRNRTTEVNIRANLYQQTSNHANQSHSTIARIVVAPSVNNSVRTRHVTVYKQHVHHDEDQAPHTHPVVYRRGEKRKLN